MAARLSKWKMKTLSIGGRLTLLKAVLGSMPIYHMSIFKVPMKVLQRMEFIRYHFFSGVELNSKKSIWVKWSNVLSSKEKGGLGVSSLYALNRALMFKWVWRFTTQKYSLWARVIKAIYGEDGKIGSGLKVGYKSIWRVIVQEMEDDVWRGDMALKQRYPRSGVEQSQLIDLMAYIEGVVLGVSPDRCVYSNSMDQSGANQGKRSCMEEFDCHVAKDNFRKICRWWNVDFIEVSSFDEWSFWIVNLRMPIKHKRLTIFPQYVDTYGITYNVPIRNHCSMHELD
ncbi:hypothetical protein Tco_0980450 [Tanacetum coccineum]